MSSKSSKKLLKFLSDKHSTKIQTHTYIFLWLTFLGQKILYVDPKNETEIFFRKALEKFGYIPEFKALYERINFISLSN
ncbi:ATP-binding protein, partial [Enterococcus innesii]|uniref:ATP-binding protein n=1 Tax=Enterococcus innesii TaxID=2839759 RepID=UPI0034A34E32